MSKTVRPTLFGRYQVAEPMRFDRMHLHMGAALKEVAWDIPIPVLDQEDLHKQGIYVSKFIPGAVDTDALGSCTCNAGTAHLAERLVAAKHALPAGLSLTDAVTDEIFAIKLYHAVTDQTGDPSQEYPPTDCGSTGLYVMTELEKQHLASSYRTATGAQNMVSLLQSGTVIQGTPWLNSWMEPDSDGFIDGDGSASALEAAINSGVAGGHETCIWNAEKLVFSHPGVLDLQKSWVVVRNSWSDSWGDAGNFRIHLSTLNWLSQYVDFKQAVI